MAFWAMLFHFGVRTDNKRDLEGGGEISVADLISLLPAGLIHGSWEEQAHASEDEVCCPVPSQPSVWFKIIYIKK